MKLHLFSLLSALLLCVTGTPSPSPDATPDLSGLSIGQIIDGLGIGLVKDINVFITLASLTDNLVSTNFDIQNPLPLELTLDQVTTSAGINGTVFAQFNHTFARPVVTPPLGTANSGNISNVLLTQGAEAALSIIPLGFLDLIDTSVHVRVATIDGFLGIPVVIDGLKQNNVTATYTLDLD